MRAVWTNGQHPSPSRPTARRSPTTRPPTARVDTAYGETAAQDPRGLRRLPRRHPRTAANRDIHAPVTGEPAAVKVARRVREEAVGKGPATRHLADGPPHDRSPATTDHRRSAQATTLRAPAPANSGHARTHHAPARA